MNTSLMDRVQIAIEVTKGAIVRAQQDSVSRDIINSLESALSKLCNTEDAIWQNDPRNVY